MATYPNHLEIAQKLLEQQEEINQLRQRAEQAEAEVERRINAEAEALVDQTMMRGLTIEDGGVNLDLVPPRELAAMWVHCAKGMLGDAPNYSETRVDLPTASMEVKQAGSIERFALIVQRVGRLTPHEARQQAEAAINRVRELHSESPLKPGLCCCGNPSPCPTIRALDGDDRG